MDSEESLLKEIVKASNTALVATEPLVSFARKATMRLRAVLLAVQLDAQLMLLLFSPLKGTQETVSFQLMEPEVPTTAAHNMLLTLDSWLEDENIRTLPATLQTTAVTLHGPFIATIDSATLDVETARHQFTSSFKQRWLPKYISTAVRNRPSETPGTFSKQLKHLLSAFNAHPFAIGFSDDEFVREAPSDRRDALSLEEYQFLVREMGIKWATDRLQYSNGVDDPWMAHQDLVKLMWGGAMETLLHVDTKAFHQPTADFSDMEQSSADLSNSLRDSILRNASSVSNMVFVGAEDSGKSTFLNAFIGTALLPTADGPTTSYPVRIRHVPGQVDPVMEIETTTLQSSLAAVRAQLWYSKISSLKDGRWKGKGLPPGYDFTSLKSRWQPAKRSFLDRFEALTAQGFNFPTKVFGVENIHNTLRDINDFVRICRNLPIGFNHFAPNEWPIITLEFPNLQSMPAGQEFELLDIPGFNGYNQEFEWDENIRQVIRAAKVLIGVVSLRQYESESWRNLPRFISSCTSMQPTAIVLTMRDYGSLERAEIASRVDFIRSQIWSSAEDESQRGPVFACSAKLGALMQKMKAFLADFNDMPEWEAFWAPDLQEASEWLFPARIHRIYTNYTLESLLKRVDDLLEWSALPGVINSITQIVIASGPQSLLDESHGIATQIKRVSFDLRRMLAAVGKAQGSVNTPGSEQERESSDDAMDLLDAWNLRAQTFNKKLRERIAAISREVAQKAEVCVDSALLDVTKVERARGEVPDSLEFETEDTIDHYMGLYADAVVQALELLEQSRGHEILGELEELHGSLFAQLRTRILEIDPSADKELPVMEQRIPSSQIALIVDLEETGCVQEIRRRYPPRAAFNMVEEKILGYFSRGVNVQERLKGLHLASRLLLALISALPFAITLPYWLRRSYIEAYKLSMPRLREILVRLAKAHSSDVFDQLEEELLVQGQLELEVAVKTISLKFAVPRGYTPSTALLSLPATQLQVVIAAMADLLAANSAMDWIATTAQPVDTPAA